MTALALLLLPAAAAWLALGTGSAPADAGRWPGPLRLPLAFGLGVATSAAVFGACLLAGLTPDPLYVAVETVVLGAAVLALLRWRRLAGLRGGGRAGAGRREPVGRLLPAAFAAVCALDLAWFAAASRAEPHGEWDAWAIWNLKARFLLHGGEHWRNLFSPLLPHPDYPLLLPWTVARLWLAEGGTPLAPALVALGFAAATVALLVSAVGAVAGRRAGLLAGLLLVATLGFVRQAAAQYADVPLAFFVLAAVACLTLAGTARRGAAAWLAGAGALAGAAALTKNEGLLFAVAAVAGALALRPGAGAEPATPRRIALLLAGAAPFLAVLAWGKLSGAWANDLFQDAGAAPLLARALDTSRHWRVAAGLGAAVLGMATPLLAPLAVATLAAGRRRVGPRPPLAAGVLALALVAAGYAAVLLATPHDPAWHVATAADRLVMQLWPAALFLLFAGVPPPVAPEAANGALTGAGPAVRFGAREDARKGLDKPE